MFKDYNLPCMSPVLVRVLTHHFAICFASRSIKRQTSFMANNAGSFTIKRKGNSPISNKARNRSLSICT